MPFDLQLAQKTRHLGATRIVQGIAPIHSVRAGSLFVQVVAGFLGRSSAARQCCGQWQMRVLSTLQASITRRLDEGASGHDLFLLDVVRDSAKQSRDGMAREIHDRIGSAASLALRQLELYELSLNGAPGEDARLSSLKEAILETMFSTRDVVTELRTRTNTAGSLQVALSSFVAAMAIEEPVVEIRMEDSGDLMPDKVGDDLFLVLRECLRNALAHAYASHVTIEARVDARGLWARVRDDGAGFPAERSFGNGLTSVLERTQLMGGQVSIDSVPGRGTVIELSVPIGGESNADA
ncbi:ATP-binding protein [Streptomyces sp. ADMS]|uniref:sensor histidine kinase n=1 Tax=Streptomyces sp. ADMS TaxID=3071415 RepID=UPI00296E8829|nr:ATP-binding protein [Streptomyces sp. ADMS]MDW4905782.1 ATP-binding protein [Streptomyces sp. ADMS]